MEIITERTLIRSVAERWKKENINCEEKFKDEYHEVLKALEGLDLETATAKDVEEIFGNDDWVTPTIKCEICRNEVGIAIIVERENMSEKLWGDGAIACISCVEEMIDSLEVEIKEIASCSLQLKEAREFIKAELRGKI